MEQFPSSIKAQHRASKPNSSLVESLFNQSKDISSEQGTVSVKDISSHLHSFLLPSLGRFYSGKKEILMKELTVEQAIKLSEILNITDSGEQLSKLAAIIDSSISGISAYELTVPDFYSVCYELRTISGESPIVVEREINGRKFTKALIKESFTVIYLEDREIDLNKYDFPRVRDKIESTRFATKSKFTDFDNVFFGYVRGSNPEEKLNNFRSLSYSEIDNLILECTKLIHGYSDTVKLYSENGESEEVEVKFDPVRLLPSTFIHFLHRDDI